MLELCMGKKNRVILIIGITALLTSCGKDNSVKKASITPSASISGALNVCTGPHVLTALNGSGEAVNVEKNSTLLAASSIYSDAACATANSNGLMIPAGQSSLTFYLKVTGSSTTAWEAFIQENSIVQIERLTMTVTRT